MLLLFWWLSSFVVHVTNSEEDRSGTRKPPTQWKVSDLDIILSGPTETWEGPRSPQGGDSNYSESLEGSRETYSLLDIMAINSSNLILTSKHACCGVFLSNYKKQMVWRGGIIKSVTECKDHVHTDI